MSDLPDNWQSIGELARKIVRELVEKQLQKEPAE